MSAVDKPLGLRTALICHADDHLNRVALANWLASFSDLVGIVELEERGSRLAHRLKAEFRRSGGAGFLDVLAFRIFYGLFLARRDAAWEAQKVQDLSARYPTPSPPAPILRATNANTSEVRRFLSDANPHMVIARCKQILSHKTFRIPSQGTWVMHPGICPEYRNAHGCFWALANGDLENVGMTLLRVDQGIDTGPVYGYFSGPVDERESHILIQHRAVFDHLDGIKQKLLEIAAGEAQPLPVAGRKSAVWGQPWMTRYLAWKWAARARRRSS
jgi:hypothetical protein